MNVVALPKLFSEREAAASLGLSVDTMQRARAAGRIRFKRLGNGKGRIRYTESDLLDYLERCEENSCRQNTKSPVKSDPIGLASAQTASNGAEHGTTPPLDKRAGSRLARAAFKKPMTGSPIGTWRTGNRTESNRKPS